MVYNKKRKRTSPPSDLTPELVELLTQYQGSWVAVSKGELLCHADSLASLREELGDRKATILRVPTAEQQELSEVWSILRN